MKTSVWRDVGIIQFDLSPNKFGDHHVERSCFMSRDISALGLFIIMFCDSSCFAMLYPAYAQRQFIS